MRILVRVLGLGRASASAGARAPGLRACVREQQQATQKGFGCASQVLRVVASLVVFEVGGVVAVEVGVGVGFDVEVAPPSAMATVMNTQVRQCWHGEAKQGSARTAADSRAMTCPVCPVLARSKATVPRLATSCTNVP